MTDHKPESPAKKPGFQAGGRKSGKPAFAFEEFEFLFMWVEDFRA
jgi:hypothetical protein